MNAITLTHSAAEGTLALGTSRGDGTAPVLKSHGFRWSRNINGGAWYIPQTRDRHARRDRIDGTAEALRTAGFTVEVEIDDASRSTAEVEADRRERSAARVEHLDTKAQRLTAQGEADWEHTRQLRELIPMGQPVMPDHYSYNRDMRFRDRLHRKEGKAIETLKEGEETARRAAAAEVNQSYHTTGPVTERRIKDLEAEQRGLQRDLDGYVRNFRRNDGSLYYAEEHTAAQGEHRDRIEARLAEIEEKLTYWREHLAELVAAGEYRTWGPDDFRKGDYARIGGRWYEVVRVNKKSLTVTVQVHAAYSRPDTAPYDKVTGRRTADEQAAV